VIRRVLTAPAAVGPYALVWRRLRRLPIDERNELATVELADDGTVAVPCSGAVHRATVSPAGDLVLHDHDVDAELAMLALGGPFPRCLVYLAVWHHARGDAPFLLAWGDDVEGDELRATREDWEGNYWESWPAEPPAARVLFGHRLQTELAMVAAVDAVRAGRRGASDAWVAVRRATQARARRAFVSSLAGVDAHPRPDALVPVRITLEVGPGGGRGRVDGRLARTGSTVELVVPADWLWTVWRPGAALTPDGRFVLSRRGRQETSVRWRATGGPEREHVPARTVRVRPSG
jgi:hypothetical protein